MTTLPRVGDLFAGRYRLEEQLGSGGFGAVYRATDLQKGRAVAVKVLQGANPDRATRARFEREADLLARIDHPGVVQVLEHGVNEAEQLYLVLELLEGEDLSALLARRGRLGAGEVTHVVAQLLSALATAQDAGVVHRDIKPANIRVVPTPEDPLRVKLLDFGIARPTDGGSPSVTATGELIGTPRYMSPEQLTGQPLTAASDLYSLGLVAMELLLGSDALPGNQWGHQLDRLRSGHMFALPDWDNPRSKHLTRVVGRMTARTPEERFANARQALAALTGPTTSYQPAPARPSARGRAAAAFAVGLALAIAAGLAAAFWPRSEPRPSNLPHIAAVPAAPSTAPSADPPPPRVEPEDVAEEPEVPEPDGCGRPPAAVGPAQMRFGAAYIPTAYDPATRYPLIVVTHDDWVEPADYIGPGGFGALADRVGAVVIVPEDGVRILGSPPQSAWRDDAEDLAFLTGAIDDMQRAFCIDPSRVFAVGNGHGGAIALDLACNGHVAGVVTNSHHYSQLAKCKEAFPALIILPRHSEMLPLDGKSTCDKPRTPRAAVEADWRERNHCRARPKRVAKRYGHCDVYTCDTPFVSCLADGGYGWPGAPRAMSLYRHPCDDPPPKPFPAADVAWDFFEKLPPIAADAPQDPTPTEAIDTPPQSP